MLTQADANRLLSLLKRLVKQETLVFPSQGESGQWELKSVDGTEAFIVDAQRKSMIKVSKCTLQERYRVVEILLRLDIDGPPHDNPDGVEVPCPHIHIYREGFEDKWAFPLPVESFSDTTDLPLSLREFLVYCNVQAIPPIQGRIL